MAVKKFKTKNATTTKVTGHFDDGEDLTVTGVEYSPPVRIVPDVFARAGNIMAYAERLDDQPFENAENVKLGDVVLEHVYLGSDGRIYFDPPAAQDTAFESFATGDASFKLEHPVEYVSDALGQVQSVLGQMDVARIRGQLEYRDRKAAGATEEEAETRLHTIEAEARERFFGLYEQLLEGDLPAENEEQIVLALESFVQGQEQLFTAFYKDEYPAQEVIA